MSSVINAGAEGESGVRRSSHSTGTVVVVSVQVVKSDELENIPEQDVVDDWRTG